jgi:two-component system chemotaxis response regulator CheY
MSEMKRSALVIERADARHSLLIELLQEQDFPIVVSALSIQNAIERMEMITFDILFVEIERGDETAFDFIRAVRFGDEALRRTPIVVVSSITALWMVAIVRDSGANGFLTKPFSRGSLGLQVTRALNHRRQFIVTNTFAGPDRRRWNDPDYRGPERRGGANSALFID